MIEPINEPHDYVRVHNFHPALDGQYFECRHDIVRTNDNNDRLYETVAFGHVVDTLIGTKSLGDLQRIGDVYVFRNYTVTIEVVWHDNGEFSLTLRSADDDQFWYIMEFAHHDFYTVLVSSALCYGGVLYKNRYDTCGDLVRVKRIDCRTGVRAVTITSWSCGHLLESHKFHNDVLVKHRIRTACATTYSEKLERICNDTVVLRMLSSGTIGNASSHRAYELHVLNGVVPASCSRWMHEGVEIYAIYVA